MAKLIKWCEKKDIKCNESPYEMRVGNQIHIFCCEQGAIQSIKDFSKLISL